MSNRLSEFAAAWMVGSIIFLFCAACVSQKRTDCPPQPARFHFLGEAWEKSTDYLITTTIDGDPAIVLQIGHEEPTMFLYFDHAGHLTQWCAWSEEYDCWITMTGNEEQDFYQLHQ
jgi:hypothetical protein